MQIPRRSAVDLASRFDGTRLTAGPGRRSSRHAVSWSDYRMSTKPDAERPQGHPPRRRPRRGLVVGVGARGQAVRPQPVRSQHHSRAPWPRCQPCLRSVPGVGERGCTITSLLPSRSRPRSGRPNGWPASLHTTVRSRRQGVKRVSRARWVPDAASRGHLGDNAPERPEPACAGSWGACRQTGTSSGSVWRRLSDGLIGRGLLFGQADSMGVQLKWIHGNVFARLSTSRKPTGYRLT